MIFHMKEKELDLCCLMLLINYQCIRDRFKRYLFVPNTNSLVVGEIEKVSSD